MPARHWICLKHCKWKLCIISAHKQFLCRYGRWIETGERMLFLFSWSIFLPRRNPWILWIVFCLALPHPPKGPHYLAYFHSRQQKEETCKVLSCLIRWVQMSMWKHILSCVPVFSLKYNRSFQLRLCCFSPLSQYTWIKSQGGDRSTQMCAIFHGE